VSDKPNPYREGMQAFSEGQTERQNPYRYGSTKWSRWQSEWVRPPSVADIPRILRDLERPGDMPTVSDLVEERNQLREWLRCMLEAMEGGDECNHCTTRDNLVLIWNMSHHHAIDCPWRVAAEYIERLEAQDVATD